MEAFAVGAHWVCAAVIGMLAVLVLRLRRKVHTADLEHRRERRLREELEAYAGVGHVVEQGGGGLGTDPMGSARLLSRRVCRTIADKSVFTRVAMLLRDPEGRFACVGSVGIDDLTLAALHAWGEKVVADERGGRLVGGAGAGDRGVGSFQIRLGGWGEFDREVGSWAGEGRRERRRWRRGLVAPIRTHSGRMLGAIVVCADGPGIDGPEGWTVGLVRAMGPIEALAARLSATLENEILNERLLRAEKLAGLGQLAGGVAHALNNPLTAVLGFAELIAETAAETRVQKDARTILLEAMKMKETVGRLVEFWRPSARADEHVDVPALVAELGSACRDKLRERGVELEMAGPETAPTIRGSRARLREVMEHLLNNAAQAIAGARPQEAGEAPHAIRITTSFDERAVHIIVADSGPGFKQPGRVFDPFYTTKGPEQGAGLGLSICYGIVREHGGEISAFNLHPHGAAVVVELPVARVMAGGDLELDEGAAPSPQKYAKYVF